MNLRQRLTNVLTILITIIPLATIAIHLNDFDRYANRYGDTAKSFIDWLFNLYYSSTADYLVIISAVILLVLPYVVTAGFSFLTGVGFKAWHKG